MSLSLHNLHFQIEKQKLIQGLNLNISRGDVFCLLGPSGCGKSTLLKIIAGFLSANSGEILISGENKEKLPSHQRNIGFFFQSYALFPHLSIEENISFGFTWRERRTDLVKSWINELLEITHLKEHRHKKPHQLSGGQQQRTALARSLSLKPDLLLLDEPLSALDPTTRGQLQQELKKIIKHFHVTTLLVTHDPNEAHVLGNQVGVMMNGQIQIQKPSSPQVSAFA